MDKIWLKSYESHVPEEITCDPDMTLLDMFEKACQDYALRRAFSNFNTALSFTDLEEQSRYFAAYLQHLALPPRSRIAIMLPNILQYPIVMFGALRAGMIVVNVNPLYTPRELKHQLKDSGASVLIVADNFLKTLAQVKDSLPDLHIITTQIGDLLSFWQGLAINIVLKYWYKAIPDISLKNSVSLLHALEQGRACNYERPVVLGQDIAYLQYTGGTTGVAKGAMLTHRNMVANVEQAHLWIRDKVTAEREVIVTALPLYHIFSLMANCLLFFRQGAENVLITNPKDIPRFIKILKKTPLTALTGVNTLFNALLAHPEFINVDFKTLKICLGGGMAVHQSVADKWLALTGQPLLEAYGLTEASPAVCINPLHLKSFNGSIGLPVPSTNIMIRDTQGQNVPVGTPGELWVQGPQIMAGYWQAEAETRAVLQEGWLATGDIAQLDEQGFVYLVDRKKDMIVVSGFNVYPNEIEEILTTHEKISEAAVIGVADDIKGETVKAFVVTLDETLTAEDIIAYCRTKLTAYKIPKLIEFRQELPKTNVGKILRRALK